MAEGVGLAASEGNGFAGRGPAEAEAGENQGGELVEALAGQGAGGKVEAGGERGGWGEVGFAPKGNHR